MIKFIVRVDDVGQAADQSKSDVGLKEFRRWWDAGKWEGLPIYLGVVPARLDDDGMGWLRDESGIDPTLLAIHGWDHKEGCSLGETDMRLALNVLPYAEVVIPPYNRYDASTFNAMKQLGLTTLLGGFHEEHHSLGSWPCMVDNVLHMPADNRLYARSYQVVENLGVSLPADIPSLDKFYQIVLHHRWDRDFLGGVKRLREKIADRMATIEEVRKAVTR